MKRLGAFLLVLGLSTGCAPSLTETPQVHIPAVSLSELAHRWELDLDPGGGSRPWRLTGSGNEIRLYEGLSYWLVNGKMLKLDDPFPVRNGEPAVLSSEIRRAEGLIRFPKPEIAVAPIRTIVIDPGHGGKDPGAIGVTGTKESGVNLVISRMVTDRLKRLGFEVILTRNDDRFIELEERARIANRRRADLFVSIHANAGGRPGQNGVEVYIPTWEFRNDSRAFEQKVPGPSRALDETDDPRLLEILHPLLSREYVRGARRLGERILDAFRKHVPAQMNGVLEHPKRLAVLRHTVCPAVLVEMGYLTHAGEEKNLTSPWYQEKVTRAIVEGIAEYKREYESTNGFSN